MKRLFVVLFVLCSLHPAFAAAGKVLDVRTIRSPGGIEAWLVEDHTVPVVSMSFSFEGGLAYDPPGKPGTGRLVSMLLDEGAGDMDSQAFQTLLTDNSIGLEFSAGRDAFFGQLKTLKANRETAFRLLALALSAPRFDADAVTRMKNQNISVIKSNMGEPGWLAERTFNGTLFAGHAYALPGMGNLAGMAAITRGDLAAFAKGQFARDVLKVSIAGDITAGEAEAALDRVFGALPAAARPLAVKDAALQSAGKTVLLPLDIPQTFISAGEAGIGRRDPDWHAAVIMNYILGGGAFDARLMKEIREKRGLTYGVYSSLVNMKRAALVEASMSASGDKAAEALKILKEEWAKMAKDGATDKEVRDAKDYLTGSLLLQLTSTDSISDTLNSLQRDDLGPDYINTRNAAIEAVTPADVKRVAARLLDPAALTVILVGQPKGVTPDITLDRPPGMDEPEPKGR